MKTASKVLLGLTVTALLAGGAVYVLGEGKGEKEEKEDLVIHKEGELTAGADQAAYEYIVVDAEPGSDWPFAGHLRLKGAEQWSAETLVGGGDTAELALEKVMTYAGTIA